MMELKDYVAICTGLTGLAVSLVSIRRTFANDRRALKVAYSSEMQILQARVTQEIQAQAGLQRRARKLETAITRGNFNSDALRTGVVSLQGTFHSAQLIRDQLVRMQAELSKDIPLKVSNDDLLILKRRTRELEQVSILTADGDPEFENLAGETELCLDLWKEARASGREKLLEEHMNTRAV